MTKSMIEIAKGLELDQLLAELLDIEVCNWSKNLIDIIPLTREYVQQKYKGSVHITWQNQMVYVDIRVCWTTRIFVAHANVNECKSIYITIATALTRALGLMLHEDKYFRM